MARGLGGFVSAMLHRLSDDSGVPVPVLESEFQIVHQRHGTVEYAFSIRELPSLVQMHPGEDLTERYARAIQEFREARRQHLRRYEGVTETLAEVRQAGCTIIGYTESLALYSAYRIRKLNLDLLLDRLYSLGELDETHRGAT